MEGGIKLEGYGMPDTEPMRKGSRGRASKWIVLLLIAILFGVTNPSTDDFSNDWVEQVTDDSDNALTKGIVSTIGKGYIEASTKRDNYVIFSIFTVNDGLLSAKYIGFLNRFFIKL